MIPVIIDETTIITVHSLCMFRTCRMGPVSGYQWTECEVVYNEGKELKLYTQTDPATLHERVAKALNAL